VDEKSKLDDKTVIARRHCLQGHAASLVSPREGEKGAAPISLNLQVH
jgi:hypothetical protein